MKQLSLFNVLNEDLSLLVVGQALTIWQFDTFKEGDLFCTIQAINMEEGTIDFWVRNGRWHGTLNILQKNLFVHYTEKYFPVLKWEPGEPPESVKKSVDNYDDSWDDDDIAF